MEVDVPREELERACEVLRGLLCDSKWYFAHEVMELSSHTKVSKTALCKASSRIGVIYRLRNNLWQWRLPREASNVSEPR